MELFIILAIIGAIYFAYNFGKSKSAVANQSSAVKLTKRLPIIEEFEFDIEYTDRFGEITERRISPSSLRLDANSGDSMITAFCYLRDSERDFLSSRILRCSNVATGRSISDLGQYLRSQV